ncbi:MAG: hypothetical protein EOO91_01660 [Pedobacter sp.]|nr:MAG: hypothetical protein EOO91_01660 [Pedobacter sp.]
MHKITLQISLAPSDFRHAIHLLPHQLKVLANQVDEVLLTYDTHKSKGHFSQNWEENNEKMWVFLKSFDNNPKVKIVKIDYSKKINQKIAQAYFRRQNIPAKDWRGGPFYTYFYGIYEAKNDYVLHIDSDIFFGGLSQTWIKEAVDLYESDFQILFISPLAGPPKADGTLINQDYKNYKELPFYFKFTGMSTRIFMVDKKRLTKYPINNIRTFKLGELTRALFHKNPAFVLPEELMSKCIQLHHLIRVDFKGSGLGLWSLHPPYRTTQFYIDLPEIIKRVELNDVPESQKGFYDIVDEFVDWTEAKLKFKM